MSIKRGLVPKFCITSFNHPVTFNLNFLPYLCIMKKAIIFLVLCLALLGVASFVQAQSSQPLRYNAINGKSYITPRTPTFKVYTHNQYGVRNVQPRMIIRNQDSNTQLIYETNEFGIQNVRPSMKIRKQPNGTVNIYYYGETGVENPTPDITIEK